MSINSISGVTGGPIVPPVTGGGFRAAMQESLNLVATQLGMSVSDLRAQMQFGKSPADVAAEKGISESALLGAIKQSLTSSRASAAANTVDVWASRIANHRGGDNDNANVQGVRGVEGAQGTLGIQAGQAPLTAANASGADTDGDNDRR